MHTNTKMNVNLLSLSTVYPPATSQSFITALSRIVAWWQITHPSIFTLHNKISWAKFFFFFHSTYLSLITTWSIITEFAIFTFLPIMQCAPTQDFLTDDFSSIFVYSPITESLPTCVLGAISAVVGWRMILAPCFVTYAIEYQYLSLFHIKLT